MIPDQVVWDPNTQSYRSVNANFPALGGVFTGQVVIVTTGVAVQLPSNPVVNGVTGSALSTNQASMAIGNSTVNNIVNGTGRGYIVQAGGGFVFGSPSLQNTNQLWANGTSGDIITFAGS